ncbi:Uu.00g037480.m01.CDS01 [Anthostomella pinea]|uniref:Uu.00g037480.m01.CDS01 n=1 Tax=Anthostomella pinea TaxID=933095 RepID=A0AAI8YDM6_9PEZI|nr:Uu.00g037480.m01.CDS01 [Anthostomella pinea]
MRVIYLLASLIPVLAHAEDSMGDPYPTLTAVSVAGDCAVTLYNAILGSETTGKISRGSAGVMAQTVLSICSPGGNRIFRSMSCDEGENGIVLVELSRKEKGSLFSKRRPHGRRHNPESRGGEGPRHGVERGTARHDRGGIPGHDEERFPYLSKPFEEVPLDHDTCDRMGDLMEQTLLDGSNSHKQWFHTHSTLPNTGGWMYVFEYSAIPGRTLKDIRALRSIRVVTYVRDIIQSFKNDPLGVHGTGVAHEGQRLGLFVFWAIPPGRPRQQGASSTNPSTDHTKSIFNEMWAGSRGPYESQYVQATPEWSVGSSGERRLVYEFRPKPRPKPRPEGGRENMPSLREQHGPEVQFG